MVVRNCYVYTRVSTATQVEGYSLDAQMGALKRYADYNGLRIVGEYCDAGKSGMTIRNRPAFQQMLDDIMTQKDSVDSVLVFKLSRFGRNAADILRSLQILEDYDVSLISVSESIDSSTSGGKLTLSILSAVAEMEHENITVQFTSGRLQRLSIGGWAGGPIPFGYRKGDKGLVIDVYEASIVKKVFELYGKDGSNATSVADNLNQSTFKRMNAETGDTRPFTYRFVTGILDNPVYCGRLWYNRRTNKKDKNGKTIIYSPEKAFMVHGSHEAIVSEEVWDHTKEKRLLLASEREKKNTNVHILSGLVRCPLCGKGLVGVVERTKHRNGTEGYCRPISYYYCRHSRKQNGNTCSFNIKINQEILDGLVSEIVGGLQFHEVFKMELQKSLCNTSNVESNEQKLKQLRAQLKEALSMKGRLGSQLDSLNPLHKDYDRKYENLSLKLDEVYDHIGELENEISELKEALSTLKAKSESFTDVTGFLANMKTLVVKMTPEERKQMFNSFISCIELFPEERADGRLIRSISFKFPLGFKGKEFQKIQDSDGAVSFSLDLSETDVILPEKGSIAMRKMPDGKSKVVVCRPTYDAIKEYVMEHFGAKVSSLAISQTKRKYGLDVHESYNKPKGPESKTPRCTPHKERLILDALKHFDLIDDEMKLLEEYK